MEYELSQCTVCGKSFKPHSSRQRTCGDPFCVKKWKNRKENNRQSYRKKDPKPVYVPKPDTIVAIGYAERQRAETLRMVGKIRVEL